MALLIADPDMRDRWRDTVDRVRHPRRIRVELLAIAWCKIERHDRDRWGVAVILQVYPAIS
jgi:hypothetical protein